MKIVVLGGTGNIGTALVRTLADRHDVTAVARRPELPGSELGSLANVAARDFAREPVDDLLEGADAVVHLGWLFQPSHRPDETWRNNAVGAARVLEACSRARVPRLVVSSSIAAYSPALDDEPVERGLRDARCLGCGVLPREGVCRAAAGPVRAGRTRCTRMPRTAGVRLPTVVRVPAAQALRGTARAGESGASVADTCPARPAGTSAAGRAQRRRRRRHLRVHRVRFRRCVQPRRGRHPGCD